MRRKRVGWLVILIALAVVFFWRKKSTEFEVKVFQTSAGYGYQIEREGKAFIYQPTIPGISGEHGFEKAEQAEKAGNLVVKKLENRQIPPALTREDLRSIGVNTP